MEWIKSGEDVRVCKKPYSTTTVSYALIVIKFTGELWGVYCEGLGENWLCYNSTVPLIAKFMGPTWGPPGSCQPQMGPMLASWTLLSWTVYEIDHDTAYNTALIRVEHISHITSTWPPQLLSLPECEHHYCDITWASNHQQVDCCCNSLLRLATTKIIKLHIIGPLWGNSTSHWWIPITKGR